MLVSFSVHEYKAVMSFKHVGPTEMLVWGRK